MNNEHGGRWHYDNLSISKMEKAKDETHWLSETLTPDLIEKVRAYRAHRDWSPERIILESLIGKLVEKGAELDSKTRGRLRNLVQTFRWLAFPNMKPEEQAFIRRAISEVSPFFPNANFDVNNKENLLWIINQFRAKGLIISRRADGGKEFSLWKQIRAKLGAPVKSQKEILKEHAKKTAIGVIERTMEAQDKRINALLKSLSKAKANKKKSIDDIEAAIDKEIDQLEA